MRILLLLLVAVGLVGCSAMSDLTEKREENNGHIYNGILWCHGEHGEVSIGTVPKSRFESK